MKQRRPAPLSRNWLLQPRTGRARGPVREGIEAIQAELVAQLHGIDAEVDRLVARRDTVVRDLRRCRDALGGIGTHKYRRVPLPGDVDAVPRGTRAVRGSELRETLVVLLRAAGRPLSLSELYRTLLAHGRHVAGRPSHTLSNALRTAVANSDATRVRPGIYVA
jgi:hypothetical protein